MVIDLVSERDQRVRIDALGTELDFSAGEAVHVEDSWKYSPQEIDKLAEEADLGTEVRWLDANQRFSLNLLAPR